VAIIGQLVGMAAEEAGNLGLHGARRVPLAFGSGADNHEQTLRVVLEPGLDVDAIGPGVTYRLADRSRSRQQACSSIQASFRRAMVEGDNPPAASKLRSIRRA